MHASHDPFATINVIAEVMIGILPGVMYKLKLPDGSEFYKKTAFPIRK